MTTPYSPMSHRDDMPNVPTHAPDAPPGVLGRVKNAGRKGRRLGAYRRGTTPCYVTLLPDEEVREMADAMVPTTPFEHHMTRTLLDVPVEWVTMRGGA